LLLLLLLLLIVLLLRGVALRRITLRRITLRRIALRRVALRWISLLIVGLLLRIALVSCRAGIPLLLRGWRAVLAWLVVVRGRRCFGILAYSKPSVCDRERDGEYPLGGPTEASFPWSVHRRRTIVCSWGPTERASLDVSM
jgi:hypothetical protein